MFTRMGGALPVCALLLHVSSAHAQDLSADPVIPPAERLQWKVGGFTLALPGELRWVSSHASAVPVAIEDPLIRPGGQGDAAQQVRLRLRPQWVGQAAGFFYLYKVAADAEFSTHLTGADGPPERTYDPHQQFRDDEQGVRLTQAYAMAAGRWVALKVGLVRGQFGVGLVANGGEDPDPDDVGQSPFDVAYGHDRNLRLQLAVFPWAPSTDKRGRTRAPLALVVAADAVIDDDTASWEAGDRTYQVLGGALGRFGDAQLAAGTLYRQQAYAEGGETKVWLAAITGRWDILRRTHCLWVEGELDSYFGTSTLSQSAIRPGAFDVQATGGVGRVGYGRAAYDLVFEGGYASGDNNAFDDQINTFTFDREHRVGLLMFRQALRHSSAATAYNVADPTFRGQPSRGFDQLANGGAVQNAIYLNPRFRYRLPGDLRLDLGYVWARSAVPVADAFRSGLAGGALVGWRGSTDATALGHEFDLGLGYDWRLAPVTVRLRSQVGVFLPGEALQDARGADAPTMFAGLTQVEVRW